MIKLFKQVLAFSLILALQSVIESTIYQLYRYFFLQMSIDSLLQHILRYSIYRFSISYLPYILLMIIAFNLPKATIEPVKVIAPINTPIKISMS